MHRQFILPVILCLVAAVAPTAQTTDSATLTALQTEVRQLRLELIQQRIEFQQWKIEQLEAAFKEAKENCEKLEEEGRAVQQTMTETSANDGDETATFRTELTETTLKKLLARQVSGQQRESELLQKLTREQALLQTLEKRAKHLKASE